MIQIKRNNKVFFTLEDFGEGSKLSYQLMDHHYIILKFTTATPVYFEIGDSVEIPDFGYFELTSAYFPKHNDSDGYDYEMQMDAYYMAWKNKLCKYRPLHGANETSFKLTTTIGVHMNVILGNLKALGITYNGKEFSVDYTTYNNKAFDVQKRFLIEYGSISIIDALNSICSEDALNCEWWIDGSIIYLGYCEMEGQTTFEQNVNVLSMSYSESKSTYITRLYAFGSDRNIPKGYFTGADADVTTDGIATDYLMLPNKEVDNDGFYAKDGYMENVNVVKSDKQAIEGVVMFEDEYPKVESVVSSIKTYDSTVDNDDGTKTTQTFWQVRATDPFATSFESSWIKNNLTLGIKFTSGALMGMEFDVSFKVIDKVNYFEIVANDTYGRTLPDGVMCPKVGDKFFLFNWDATKITDTNLIPNAQLSLFNRAKQYYQKAMISNSNFTCTMDGEKFYNDGIYDYHPIGEQVKLINDMFAQVDADGKHYRNSRIIGMEIPLDIPYDHPQYTVGEKAATSRLGKLEDKVDSITVNGIQIGGTGSGNGGGVYVIGLNDNTSATDSNVYSARRIRNNFLSKVKEDTAKEVITFEKGLTVGSHERGESGAAIDAAGAAEVESIVVRRGATFGQSAYIDAAGDASLGNVSVSGVRSQGFTEGDRTLIGGKGFELYKDGSGKSHLYVDNAVIRGKLLAAATEIRKVSYSGGTLLLSNAGSTLARVAAVTDDKGAVVAYKCWAKADDGTTQTMNWWRIGMMALCQTFNVSGYTGGNRRYWRLVVGVGQERLDDGKIYDYVLLSNVARFSADAYKIPYYSSGSVLTAKGDVLRWAGEPVGIVRRKDNISFVKAFALQEGSATDVQTIKDDDGVLLKNRGFYGYEPTADGGAPDAPMAGDVIVQCGDQVRWLSRGNVIRLCTSSDDGDMNTTPSLSMYHGIGRLRDVIVNGEAKANKSVWQWRDLTALISPTETYINSDYFYFFSEESGGIEKAQSFSEFKMQSDKVAVSVRDVATGIEKAGVHLNGDDSCIVAKANKFYTENSAGVRTSSVDEDGNLIARSLHSVSKSEDKVLSVDIEDGMITMATTQSNAKIQLGLDTDGLPAFIFYNPDGTIGLVISANGTNAKPLLNPNAVIVVDDVITGSYSYSVATGLNGGKMHVLSYTVKLTVKNNSGNIKLIKEGVVTVKVRSAYNAQMFTLHSQDSKNALNQDTLEMTFTNTEIYNLPASTIIAVADHTTVTVENEGGRTWNTEINKTN